MKKTAWMQYAAFLGTAAFILFIMLYRLDQYPSPWYDEGAFLKVAKNLAVNGIYADYSSEGNRYLGPVVSTGPTVLLPIALLLKLVGVTVLGARLLMVIYACLMLVAVYKLSRQLGASSTTALLSALIISVSPGVYFQFYGRVVLGEVAGVFFWLTGLYLWLLPGRLSIARLVVVGVLFGLTCITKLQFALFVLPAIFVSWICDIIWYRQRGWRYFVVPGLLAGLLGVGWLVFAVFILGGQESAAANWEAFRAAGSNAFNFDLANLRQTIDFLNGEFAFRGLFLSGLVYSIILALPRGNEGQRWNVIVWMVFFAAVTYLFSIADWTRYAMPALVLVAICLPHLWERLTGTPDMQLNAFRDYLRSGALHSKLLASVLLTPFLLWMILSGAVSAVTAALRQGEYNYAYQVADYVRQHIPTDAVIETWDKELSILTDHIYHYPPQLVEIELGKDKWRGGKSIAGTYNFRDYVDADYVIVGPFSQFAGVYTPEILKGYDLIQTIGYYEIYQRKPVS